ncbi:MAG: hypothetical protein QCI82_01455 [Candidatus Thermoplasmatota archaeon]|nr:hypothetical protein [Candidatus Thermoplasmatota archaeon]
MERKDPSKGKAVPHLRALNPVASIFLEPNTEHRLYVEEGRAVHEWIGPDSRPIMELTASELRAIISDHSLRMADGSNIIGSGGHAIKFNVLDETAARTLGEIALSDDVKVSTESSPGYNSIRLDIGGSRYSVDLYTELNKDRMGDYLLLRLNSRSNPAVVRLVGFSYWEFKDRPLIWSRLTEKNRSCIPALRPFLGELEELLSAFSGLEGEDSRRFLMDLASGKRFAGSDLSLTIGSQIAEMHLDLVTVKAMNAETSNRIGDRIVNELSLSRFDMAEVGSLLGKMGHFMSSVKRDLARITGEVSLQTAGRRKQKVIRISPRMDEMRSRGLEAMPLLMRKLYQREREIRQRTARLKELVGSPAITCLIDTSLERAEAEDGHVLFSNFDWSFSGDESRQLRKVPPIKDLSLALNSLMKVRLLIARKSIRKEAVDLRMAPSRLWLMYLEYNLSKRDYDSMRTDFRIRDLIRTRETPFRKVFSISIIGALWYELCRREMVRGYMDTIMKGEIPALLDYPKRADIAEAISSFQVLTAMSQLSPALSGGNASIPTLESDAMIVLTR